jgi:hypothetical protein
MAKSPERCAIATLPNQHESGTFSPAKPLTNALKGLPAAGIGPDRAR